MNASLFFPFSLVSFLLCGFLWIGHHRKMDLKVLEISWSRTLAIQEEKCHLEKCIWIWSGTLKEKGMNTEPHWPQISDNHTRILVKTQIFEGYMSVATRTGKIIKYRGSDEKIYLRFLEAKKYNKTLLNIPVSFGYTSLVVLGE